MNYKKTLLATTLALTSTLSFAELQLQLGGEQLAYQIGEPVVLQVKLINNGPKTEEVAAHLAPEFAAVQYEIIDPLGRKTKFTPWAIKEPANPFVNLATGKSLTQAAKIFFGGDGWTFTENGVWQVKAIYQNNLSSNTVQVFQNPAENAEDEIAGKMIISEKEAGYFLLFEAGDHLKKGIAVLKSVADKHPDSVQSHHANYALGISLAAEFADFTQGKLRKAKPAEAIERLKNVDVERFGLYHTVRRHIVLADAYDQLGKKREATREREELEEAIYIRFPSFVPDLKTKLVPSAKVKNNRK